MPQESLDQDLASLKEWISKETYLPQDFDSLMLKKFLHSCYGSLERTKKCIERIAIGRAEMSEIYTNRDPQQPNLQTAFSITCLGTYRAGNDEILIHQLDDPTLENFAFYDLIKAFSIQNDLWLRYVEFYPDSHILVLDIKDYTWKAVAKSNVLFFKDYVLLLLEGVPVRMKQLHLVNCPPYIDKLFSLVKSIIPAEVRDLIRFHANPEGLHKYIDKKYLPTEYGGDAQSLREQQNYWVDKVMKERDWYLNDNSWKADLSRRPKNGGAVMENAMNGSFRSLSID